MQLDHDIEQMQNQDDMLNYEEPDLANEYLANSVALSGSPEGMSDMPLAGDVSKTLSNDEIDF